MDIKEAFSSKKLVVNVKQEKKLETDECNTSTDCNPKAKISLIGIRRQKNGRYAARITNPIRHKKVWLGTFDTVEEASQAYFSKKSEFENEKLRQRRNKKSKRIRKLTRIYNSEKLVNVKQGNENVNGEIFQSESGGGSEIDVLISNSSNGGTEEKIDSHKIGVVEEAFDFAKEGSRVFYSGLMANVCGTKSSDECNKITSCDPKARRSLIGIRRRKSGKYAAVITDPIKHKEVCLGTFNTIEEASQAYFSKKSEFEKLRQGNKVNKQKKNCDQIQQPESPSVVTSLDTTAGESGSAKRIGSHKTATRLVGAHKSNKTGRYKSEITNPITKKRIYLGTFGSAEEASHAYQSKKLEFQKLVEAKQQQCTNKRRKSEKLVNVKQELENVNCEPLLPEAASGSPDIDVSFSNSFNEGTFHSIDSDKKGTAEEAFHFAKEGSRVFNSGLMANVCGTKSSDECNKTISCDPKARRSLIGIRRQKSGRYAAVITDPIKHKEVYLGTFASIEEASQAYFSKKLHFEKLRQGNKENKQKKNRDQIQQPESPSVVTSLDTTAGESGSAKRIGPHKTTRLIGAYKSKTRGRYGSEIINPITKKKIWLGTFGSAEEASHAYQSKKLEFQKLVEAKQQQCTNKQGLENVNCESLLPESASGYVSFSNSFNEGTAQSIDSDKRGTGEEAFHAYQPKKFDLQSSKEVELQSKMQTDSSAGTRQENQEDDEDLWTGEWVQLPGDDREVMFSLKLGLPIIDNYGSLLGEFSSLDDLSIS